MLVKGEIVWAFNGTYRDTLWGVELPPFDGSALGITMDAIAGDGNVVPFRYEAGVDYFIEDSGVNQPCMSFIFKLGGPVEMQDAQLKLIGDFTKALTYDWDKFHVAYRALANEESRAVRTLVYRVYENNGECTEHPEMLCGLPCGHYHCPVCSEMVVAGLPHPPKEAYAKMLEEERAEYYAQTEKSLNTYAELEQNWGGDGEEKPIEASLKNAGEFFATIKENRLPAPDATLDHEGVVALLWPDNHDPDDTYVSMAFYADETVGYWKRNAVIEESGSVTIPRDEIHEERLLHFLHTRLPQLSGK